nr:MAG: hypothetical protein [Bacteriophage sp.]
MSLDTNTLAIEISNALTAAGKDCTTTVVDLDIYGTSCEITKHGSGRKLHLTPVDDNLIDMVLFDETGNTIANGTLFSEVVTNITPEELANLITICF